MSCISRIAVVAVVALLLAGCGSESCPSVAGTWKIVGHCEASMVNRTVAVSQSGCAITYADPFPGWTGTISAAGTVTVTGPGTPPTQMTCNGTVMGVGWTLACTPACQVILQKQ
jgi:hypothetical protein